MRAWAKSSHNLSSKTYHCTTPALDTAAYSVSYLVSPSCSVSEYFIAGALLFLLNVLKTFLSYSCVLFLCYIILLSYKFSSFSMVSSMHKLLESPLYYHSICFYHLLSLKTLNPTQSVTL